MLTRENTSSLRLLIDIIGSLWFSFFFLQLFCFSLLVAADEARFTEVMKHFVYQIMIYAKYKLTFLCILIIALLIDWFLIVKIWSANYLKKFPLVFFHEEGSENERFTITESLLARWLANFHHQWEDRHIKF